MLELYMILPDSFPNEDLAPLVGQFRGIPFSVSKHPMAQDAMQEKWSSFARKPGQRHLAKSAVRWERLRQERGDICQKPGNIS